jgi:hypothetical protein
MSKPHSKKTAKRTPKKTVAKKPALTDAEKIIAECKKWESPELFLENREAAVRETARAILIAAGIIKADSAKFTPAPDALTERVKKVAADDAKKKAVREDAREQAATEKAKSTRAASVASKPVDPEKLARGVQVFFDVRDQSYWFKVGGNFLSLGSSDLSLHLKAMGIRDDVYVGALDLHEFVRHNAQTHQQVQYAGPLAGHKVGVYLTGAGEKLLVSQQAAGVWEDFPAKAPEPKFFAEFIRELLPSGQWSSLCFWMAHTLKELRRGTFGPGQAVFLVGVVRCGKSLLQQFITEIFGGRVSNPFRYLTDKTQFNEDLASGEHWMIEDPKTTTDSRARQEFGDNIKEAAVSRQFTIHPKNKKQIYVPLLRRLTVSINPEKLARIPPIDGDFADKVFVLKCDRVEKAFAPFMNNTPALPGMPAQTPELDQGKLWQAFKAEVPAIRAWLLSAFGTVPENMRDARFGVESYQHPELLAELSELATEFRLLELIDALLWPKPDVAKGEVQGTQAEWTGLSLELHQLFQKNHELRDAYNGVCRSHQQTGTYLSKLMRNPQLERVSKLAKSDGYQPWKIVPPSSPKTPE